MCRVCERLSYDPPLPDVPSENEDDNDYVYRPYDVPVRSIRKQLIPIQIVVEPAPSHDGTPIFAAWEKPRIAQRGDWDYPSPRPKPPFGMAVYDITPTATPTRAAKMAHALSRLTRNRNTEWGGDRIEVVCFPLPSHLTCQERAKACISHHGHEVRNRAVIDNIDDAKFWFLPEDFINEWYSRGLILIDRLEDTWEDAFDCDERVIQYEDENTRSPFGSFATVYWLPREATWEYYEEEFRPEDRVNMQKYGLESIGRMLGREGIGNSIRGFYEHFTSDGVLDRELAVARTS
ncbi:ArcA-like protein [Colletotrichum scovillei]|uniref:ArcA-like protein n=1 Tax=Colletotrichum scovillei TaxID=1209932 RepID=A0A9P7R9M4_9PEZI|nr:ArcA-like protein [Colletotrichum scovillei]KAG7071742.1 ArcA-like protein [Colletotrichum scovillei]KAG7079984.1 ArcA-like protein [Colletotrichum scovillei]